jgi:hypothetical protein
MEASWIAIFGIVFGQLSFVAIVFVWWRTRQRKMELQAEVQSKLIDRFGSTPELVEFLQSPAGREFVNGVQSGAVIQSRERVLAGVRRSVVLTFLGIAFAGMWIAFDRVGFAVPTILFFALGVGNLAATFISLTLGRRLTAAGEVTRASSTD